MKKNRRKLEGHLGSAVFILATAFGLMFLYIAGFGLRWRPTELNLVSYLFFSFTLIFLIYAPSEKLVESRKALAFDICLAVITSASLLYWLLTYATYAATRVGNPTRMDLLAGVIIMIASLEATRRALGKVLSCLGIIFLLTLYFGPHLPAIFSHRGFSVVRIIESIACTTGGIYGSITAVFASYIMPFMVFGAFLQKSGGGEFFIDLAKAIGGRFAGGAGLITIGTVALFGTISGSPVACVMAVGFFCIPMMKKAGYDDNFSGAVTASAATGAQFSPPIMGAGAFILATLTGVPYSRIIVMAALPALLYFMSLMVQTYFNAKRHGLVGLKPEEQPRLSEVLKKGWHYLFVLVGCTVLIALGFSIPRMAFGATVIVIACAMVRKENRFTVSKFLDACATAGRDSLVIGAAAGTLGIIMGSINLSGMGVNVSAAILALSQGNLFISVILVAIIATIVGLGLPTTASYIILAILAAPALVRLGMEPVHAHLLAFWLCMASNVTPPVAVAAIAASGISGGDPTRTGMRAFQLSIYLYLMPFAFVYAPQITILGHSIFSVLEVFITWSIATVSLAAVIQGWYIRVLNIHQRLVMLIVTVLLVYPNIVTHLIAVGILVAMTWMFRRSTGRMATA